MGCPLASDWLSLCHALGARSTGRELLERLVEAYREEHRAYHTLDHVLHCLKWFATSRHLAGHPDEVEAALWLHDVVYDPRAAGNEERSAEWATEALTSAGVAEEKTVRIAALILATRHDQPSVSGDAALVVDIDLSILGEDPSTFDEYGRRVRQEYAWVPEETFRAKRAALLQGLLARPRIYHTAFFREQLEARARGNMVRAVRALDKA